MQDFFGDRERELTADKRGASDLVAGAAKFRKP